MASSKLPPGVDLCSYPALTPPGLQPSNLVNPPSLAATTIAVTTVTLVWAVALTAARLSTRFRKLGLADCAFCATSSAASVLTCVSDFVFIALALSAAYAGLVLAMTKYARHQWDIPACWYNGTYVKLLFAGSIVLSPTIFFAKCSIFLLFLQIFTIHQPMRIAIWAGIVFTFLLYWANLPLASYFNAPHVGETWEAMLFNGRPHLLIDWAIIQGACSVVLDIYIFILPIPLLTQLQMPQKRRLQLLAIFSTALMGIVASVCALVFRVQLKTTTDTSYIQSAVFICLIVENNVAIIVSSMPFFPSFIRSHILETGLFKSLQSRLSALRHSSNKSAHIEGSLARNSRTSGRGWKQFRGHPTDDDIPIHSHEMQDVPKSEVAVRIHAGSRRASREVERGINREVNFQQETHSIV